MEAPSVPAHRGHITKYFFTLAVLLSIFWIPPCHGGVEFHYPKNSITIYVTTVSNNSEHFIWIKGDVQNVNNRIATYIINTREEIPGPRYDGRQIIKHHGSLKINNIIKEDTGYYTFLALQPNFQGESAATHLVVLATVPFTSVQESQYTVQENEKIIMVCMPSDPGYTVYWFFNNRRLYFNDRIQHHKQKRVISIMPIKREDAGKYHCKYVKRLSTQKTEDVALEVV